jgi:hypothetical protein
MWDKLGKSAGVLRNVGMIDGTWFPMSGGPDIAVHLVPDLVIAFPGGKGTAHAVKTAESRGIRVMRYGW